MLYKEKSLYFEEHNEFDYLIKSCEKEPSLSRYKAKTVSGNTLKILIRWKNGNGVAFPAFQISQIGSIFNISVVFIELLPKYSSINCFVFIFSKDFYPVIVLLKYFHYNIL